MFHASPRVSRVAAVFATLSLLGVIGCSLGAVGCSVERDAPPAATTPPAETAKPAPPSDASDAQRPKVVVLGDSLTAGYGLVETDSFPAALQQKIDKGGYSFQVVNAGVSGDTTAGGLRRLDWALDGDVRVATYTDARRFRPDMEAFLPKVRVAQHADIPGNPEEMHVELTVTLVNGERIHVHCDGPKGLWGKPKITHEEHLVKVRDCLATRLDAAAAERCIERVERLEELDAAEVAELMRELRGGAA